MGCCTISNPINSYHEIYECTMCLRSSYPILIITHYTKLGNYFFDRRYVEILRAKCLKGWYLLLDILGSTSEIIIDDAGNNKILREDSGTLQLS